MDHFQLTIRKALKAPELNQLILTFGLAIAFTQIINLIFTSQTYKIPLDYVSASMTIGDLTFGIWSFVFVPVAILFAYGLQYFLTRTNTGKAALAVGQNPRGAEIVGIDVVPNLWACFCNCNSAPWGNWGRYSSLNQQYSPWLVLLIP